VPGVSGAQPPLLLYGRLEVRSSLLTLNQPFRCGQSARAAIHRTPNSICSLLFVRSRGSDLCICRLISCTITCSTTISVSLLGRITRFRTQRLNHRHRHQSALTFHVKSQYLPRSCHCFAFRFSWPIVQLSSALCFTITDGTFTPASTVLVHCYPLHSNIVKQRFTQEQNGAPSTFHFPFLNERRIDNLQLTTQLDYYREKTTTTAPLAHL
jgi:hypothetical protein